MMILLSFSFYSSSTLIVIRCCVKSYPQDVEVSNNKFLSSHSFCMLGIQVQLRWVPLAQSLLCSFHQPVGQDFRQLSQGYSEAGITLFQTHAHGSGKVSASYRIGFSMGSLSDLTTWRLVMRGRERVCVCVSGKYY